MRTVNNSSLAVQSLVQRHYWQDRIWYKFTLRAQARPPDPGREVIQMHVKAVTAYSIFSFLF
jgi:hypothetical protein